MNVLEQAEKQNQIITDVRKQFSGTVFPEIKRENLYHGMPKKDNYLEGYQALANDQGEVYSFVSDAYTLVRHEVVVDRVMHTLKDFPSEPNVQITFPNNGAKMLMRIEFEKEFQKIAKNIGDKISPSIKIKNSYDKHWGLQIGFGAKELVCSNGMTLFKVISKKKKKHIGCTINADLLFSDGKENFLYKEMSKFFDTFKEELEMFSSWNNVKLNEEKYTQLKKEMPFSEKEHEHIEQMPLIGRNTTIEDMLKNNNLTLWEYNRAGTQYTTHELEDFKAINYEEQIAKTLTNYHVKTIQ